MLQRIATEARRMFFQLLDAAAEPASLFDAVYPAVLSGKWHWSADDEGQLQFEANPETLE